MALIGILYPLTIWTFIFIFSIFSMFTGICFTLIGASFLLLVKTLSKNSLNSIIGSSIISAWLITWKYPKDPFTIWSFFIASIFSFWYVRYSSSDNIFPLYLAFNASNFVFILCSFSASSSISNLLSFNFISSANISTSSLFFSIWLSKIGNFFFSILFLVILFNNNSCLFEYTSKYVNKYSLYKNLSINSNLSFFISSTEATFLGSFTSKG